ncbi:Rpn family recombination-promoting nuclease/putative transposase [Roseofilum sp. BLCC_M154]|uniref:Rpn family recombination-promoting nuclease/putative transposase n=1 Tax=Roseofilum acuticapitatum BLCC-M154 TaxID=3022444 RepID=A0ABT7AUZ0_9CYAN|nr:Rpn family recombination-promoting nuclease/putative transposase [Roseofilum acuticapitatum]MDJ1170729.1 Rpn family recombination-promoting nuclease/putative transposase [Roseofilum acuticapitatum BLCC-M154]
MAYDNACKYLAEKFPESFIQWLLPQAPTTPVEVLKTELIQEPIRADSLTFLKAGNQILHIEFETRPYSQPPLPFRMLDYYVRLKRQYGGSVHQVVIFLREMVSEQVLLSKYQDGETRHPYQVIRLWEQDPNLLLSSPGLLPLATLSKTTEPRQLLQQVANRVATIEESKEQADVLACSQVLAGLRFDKKLIRQLLRKETMRESVIYQEIHEEGLLEGIQRGIQQGIQRGIQQGIQRGVQREASLVIRLLTRRVGALSPEMEAQIQSLSVETLEDLGEALLDFTEVEDLVSWLGERLS